MTILYIEDNPDDHLYVSTLLKNIYEVICVKSLEEAIPLLSAKDSLIEILLIDYFLKSQDGISIFLHITDKLKVTLPSVLITGKGDEKLAVDAITNGMDNYISKEILSKQSLTEAIDEAIIRHNEKKILQKRNEILKNKALYDPLTKLANRTLLLDTITKIIDEQEKRPYGFSILFLDLDGFKEVNDNFGHDVGDELLIVVATKLSHVVRSTDLASRYGGDEFILLLPGMCGMTTIESLAKRISAEVSNIKTVLSKPVSISVSIGATPYNPGDTADIAIKRADEAMYKAKNGDETFCFLK